MNPGITTRNPRLLPLLRRELARRPAALAAAALALLGAIAMDLLAPWPMKIVLDHVLLAHPLPPALQSLGPLLARGPTAALALLAAAIVAIAIAGAACNYAQTFLSARIGHEIAHTLRLELFAHVQRLPLAFHARQPGGELLTRIANDTALLRDAVADWSLKAASELLLVAGVLGVMLIMDWRLGLAVAATLPLLFLALRRLATGIRNAARTTRRTDGRLVAHLGEALGAVALVQTFGRERQAVQAFEAVSLANRDAGIRGGRLAAAMSRLVSVAAALAVAGTVMLGGSLALSGTLSPGSVLIFIAYVTALFKPVKDLGKLWAKFARARASGERVAELLAMPAAVADPPAAIPARDARGALTLRQVTFGYEPGRPLLRELSLRIRAGEHIAILGASGAGKSTLLRLLARLYEPDSGCIYLDERALTAYTRESLRDAIGIVLQEAVFLGATVAENIAFGRPAATREQIEAAARLAGAHEFICALPQGYDTPVGERGGRLSGGQRQRLSLARTLLCAPAVLILDEPVSAVDHESAVRIEQAIATSRRGRTTLVIGHQFANLDCFDRVLEVRDGRIEDITPPRDGAIQALRRRSR